MSDIALVLNTADITKPPFDIGFASGDLSTDDTLRTAVMLSLFTDRRAPAGFTPPDGSNDLRGCWIDTYEGEFGSLLWTLYRAKISNRLGTLKSAKVYAEQSLAWMVDLGIVAKVVATATWINNDRLSLVVDLYQPNKNSPISMSFSKAWQNL